jgi:hypothetical protein
MNTEIRPQARDRRPLGPFTWIAIAIMIVLFLGCLILFLMINKTFAASFHQGRARGITLVIAIGHFHEQCGRYPATLDELVPAYIDEIPRPAPGWEYYYEGGGTGYCLHFDLRRSDDFCDYCTSTKEWRCVDSIPYSYEGQGWYVP